MKNIFSLFITGIFILIFALLLCFLVTEVSFAQPTPIEQMFDGVGQCIVSLETNRDQTLVWSLYMAVLMPILYDDQTFDGYDNLARCYTNNYGLGEWTRTYLYFWFGNETEHLNAYLKIENARVMAEIESMFP